MLPCTTREFSPRDSNSSSENDRAKKPRASSMRSGSMTHAPGSGVATNLKPRPPRSAPRESPRRSAARSWDHLHGGNRHDELRAPLPRVRELGDDLVLEVPGKDEDVVGPRLPQALGRVDRDVGTGREAAVLVWIAVDGVVDEVGPDPAVVE